LRDLDPVHERARLDPVRLHGHAAGARDPGKRLDELLRVHRLETPVWSTRERYRPNRPAQGRGVTHPPASIAVAATREGAPEGIGTELVRSCGTSVTGTLPSHR